MWFYQSAPMAPHRYSQPLRTLASCRTGHGPIPIPVVERVTSPWALAEQAPPTQPTQSQATQQQPEAAAGAGVAGADAPAGRPSMGGLPPRSGRRGSLLAVSNARRASGATPGAAGAASGATPGGAAQPTPVNPNPTGQEGKLPTPWSTLRPWDGKTAQGAAEGAAAGGEAQQAEPAASGDENQAGPPQQQAAEQQAESGDGKQQQAGKASASTRVAGSGGTRRTTRHAAAEAAEAADSDAPGPTHGCIALTSVDPAVVDLARSATRRLRGLRLCPEGREEGQVCSGAEAFGGQLLAVVSWCATVLCHLLAQDARPNPSQHAATCCPAPPRRSRTW